MVFFYATMVNILRVFLHTVELFTWGLGFYNATMKILIYFLSAKQIQKSKYAKVIHAMLKCKYR